MSGMHGHGHANAVHTALEIEGHAPWIVGASPSMAMGSSLHPHPRRSPWKPVEAHGSPRKCSSLSHESPLVISSAQPIAATPHRELVKLIWRAQATAEQFKRYVNLSSHFFAERTGPRCYQRAFVCDFTGMPWGNTLHPVRLPVAPSTAMESHLR